MPLTIGDTFAGYRLLRQLGVGGMGEVYLVEHPRLPRHEALKVLRPNISQDSSFRERFIREADLASGLRHPNIVGIHDRGEHEGQLWIAMDYIDGTDLSEILERRFPQGMPVGHVVPIVTALASALDYAHNKGLLHRDVKPANIIVADLDTGDPSIYLTDFGIARPIDDTNGITTTNMTVGTVAYAAPEQLMGEQVDGRTDLYALTATTYHLLTGVQPFLHTNPAVVISHHLSSLPPPASRIYTELQRFDAVLARGLAKKPDDRYLTCTGLAQAFVQSATDSTAGDKTQSAAITQSASAVTKHARSSKGPRPQVAATPGASAESSPADSNHDTFWDRHALAISVTSVIAIAASVAVVLAVDVADRPTSSQSGPDSTSFNGSSSILSLTTTPISTASAPPAASTTASPQPPTSTVMPSSAPATRTPAASSQESEFLESARTQPYAVQPNGRFTTDLELLDWGYRACHAMDEYPDNQEAVEQMYPNHRGSTSSYDQSLMVLYATRLCPEHAERWSNF